MKKITIEFDGNDGVGKTFLINKMKNLLNLDVEYKDRGQLTTATDTNIFVPEDNHLYILLDADPEYCQKNILQRGGSIEEKYHTLEDLTYYRYKFLDLANQHNIKIFNAEKLRYNVEELKEYIKTKINQMEKEQARNLVKEKLGVDFKEMTLDDFRKLPLFVEGESKEIRLLDESIGIIYFKPTIYSFTANRTGIVPGSNVPRVKVSEVLCEYLKSKGIKHAYIDYADEFVITHIVDAPNIEIVVKANHTGTSKHRYFGMNQSTVRKSHPYFAGMEIKNMDSYPHPIVRFDWRNPFKHPETQEQLADEVMCNEQADWYIDVKNAKETARLTFDILQDFLNEKDIMIYDLCLFISEDGKTVYGEISPDCGRYRHYNLGSLDKDVWRAGGSSADVLEKWNLLHKMITG